MPSWLNIILAHDQVLSSYHYQIFLIQHYEMLGICLRPSFLRRLIDSYIVEHMQSVDLHIQSGCFDNEKHPGAHIVYPVNGNALRGLPLRYYCNIQERLVMYQEGPCYLDTWQRSTHYRSLVNCLFGGDSYGSIAKTLWGGWGKIYLAQPAMQPRALVKCLLGITSGFLLEYTTTPSGACPCEEGGS